MRKSHKQKVLDKKRYRAWDRLYHKVTEDMVNDIMVEIDKDIINEMVRTYYPNENRNSEE